MTSKATNAIVNAEDMPVVYVNASELGAMDRKQYALYLAAQRAKAERHARGMCAVLEYCMGLIIGLGILAYIMH